MNGAIGRNGPERGWKRRRTLRGAGLRCVRHRLRRRHHRPTGAVGVLVEADLVDRDWPETDRREQSGARLEMVVALRGIDEAGVLLLEDPVLYQVQRGVAPGRHRPATAENIAPDMVDAGLDEHGGHLRVALEIQVIDVEPCWWRLGRSLVPDAVAGVVTAADALLAANEQVVIHDVI